MKNSISLEELQSGGQEKNPIYPDHSEIQNGQKS